MELFFQLPKPIQIFKLSETNGDKK